jgi:SAM-dependent methyltransferase
MRCDAESLDAPTTTASRQRLLAGPCYLRQLYTHWYRLILRNIPDVRGEVLELGSGGGFLKEMLPGLRTSDVMPIPGVEMAVDARTLPFGDGSLRAIVGTNVPHHIQGIGGFLAEAERTLADSGRLVFIEPWPTPLSRIVYRHAHHEPFDETRDWSIPDGGPLSAANGALPWIVFRRDSAHTSREFPSLRVREVSPLMPFSYILSGGMERAWRMPSWLFPIARAVERPADRLGLFALLVVERRPRHGT